MMRRRTWNVLLVDDSPGDAHLVRSCAEEHPSVEIFHAPDAMQANRYLYRTSPFEDVSTPDLVLLDLRMPMFNGFDVLAGMRESAALTGVPVVVLTSSNLLSDRQRCRDLGSADYIVKPAEWGAWLTTITRVFRRHLKGFMD